jgi:hypothetical protein
MKIIFATEENLHLSLLPRLNFQISHVGISMLKTYTLNKVCYQQKYFFSQKILMKSKYLLESFMLFCLRIYYLWKITMFQKISKTKFLFIFYFHPPVKNLFCFLAKELSKYCFLKRLLK